MVLLTGVGFCQSPCFLFSESFQVLSNSHRRILCIADGVLLTPLFGFPVAVLETDRLSAGRDFDTCYSSGVAFCGS